MTKQNKVLEFANRQTAKAWTNIQIVNVRPSVDPNLPPLYLMDVQGLRGDGVVFTIQVAALKDKFNMLPPSEAFKAMVSLMNDGLKQLMTFTGCACTKDTECEEHKKPLVQ